MRIARVCFFFLFFWHLRLLPAQEKTVPALSLTLPDAIRLALSPKGNLEIDVASQSVVAAQARLRQSQAAVKPTVDFSFNAVNQRLNLDLFGFQSVHVPGFTFPRVAGPFEVLEAQLHIRQTLFSEENLRRNKMARAGIAVTQSQTDEVRDQIVGKVARLYFQAQRDASAVTTAEALVVTAESSLKQISNRKDEGQVLGLDVSQARVEVAAAKQSLLKVQLEKARTEIELLNTMNRNLNTRLQLTDPLTFVAQDIPPADQAVATALQSRGDILSMQKKMQVTHLNEAAIHSERLPTVAGYVNGGSTGTSIPKSAGTYSAGVTLTIPVLDGGRRESQRAEVMTVVRQQELQLAQLQKRVEIEVREALLQMDLAHGNVELAEVRYRVAQDKLQHLQRNYAQGIGSQMDVNNAQADLARMTDGRMAALRDWNNARVDLLQALGTVRSLEQ